MIGKYILELLETTNLTNAQILDKVLARYPDAKTTTKSIASVASTARRFGKDIAKRASSNPELDALRRENKVLKYLLQRSQRAA